MHKCYLILYLEDPANLLFNTLQYFTLLCIREINFVLFLKKEILQFEGKHVSLK